MWENCKLALFLFVVKQKRSKPDATHFESLQRPRIPQPRRSQAKQNAFLSVAAPKLLWSGALVLRENGFSKKHSSYYARRDEYCPDTFQEEGQGREETQAASWRGSSNGRGATDEEEENEETGNHDLTSFNFLGTVWMDDESIDVEALFSSVPPASNPPSPESLSTSSQSRKYANPPLKSLKLKPLAVQPAQSLKPSTPTQDLQSTLVPSANEPVSQSQAIQSPRTTHATTLFVLISPRSDPGVHSSLISNRDQPISGKKRVSHRDTTLLR